MANTISTPNMGLSLPVPGPNGEPGPDYGNTQNSAFTIIDGHGHTNGSGVPITSSAININSTLPFNGNPISNVAYVNLSSLSSNPTLNTSLYSQGGVDLFFQDGVGNQIRITQSGSVTGAAGTITGLPSGTASAAYNSGTFIFQLATNTPANMDIGEITLRNNTAGSNGVTLSPVGGLGSNYTLTLPQLNPVGTCFLTLDTSGSITAGITVTAGITGSMIGFGTITAANIASFAGIAGTQIGNQTITATNIANNTITRTQEAAVGQAISSSSGIFSTNSTSLTTVTGVSVSLTTTGRPVIVALQSDSTGSAAELDVSSNGFNFATMNVAILRGGSVISNQQIKCAGSAFMNSVAIEVPASSIHFLDVVAAGTYTYTLQISATQGGGPASIRNAVLVVYEL